MSEEQPVAKVRLSFGENPTEDDLKAAISQSGVAFGGGALWLAADESIALRSFRAKNDGTWVLHGRHALGALFPDDLEVGGEADLEGLAVDGNTLWMVGSHALRRKQPKADGGDRGPRKALALKKSQPNRLLLGRVDLASDDQGLDVRSARCLPIKDESNQLTRALAEDDLLKDFLALPSKDNGLDIEGLAVRGNTLFVGLRGPVLRGWALILQCECKPKGDVLELETLEGDRPYRLHALDLGGLGIRDLAADPDGETLWILAGPTMALDGPVRLFRWQGGLTVTSAQCVGGLKSLMDLPVRDNADHSDHSDHAEGIALVPASKGEPRRLLVVYDSPAADRFLNGRDYDADLFRLPDL